MPQPVASAARKTLKPSRNNSAKPIRALIDAIEETPVDLYGTKRSRLLRRLVHIILAKHADANGSNAFPSISRIAYLCLASERATQDAINHLITVGLVRKLDGMHDTFGTRRYELVAPPADVVEREKDRRWETLKRKRETTRARVARWRSRQSAGSDLTAGESVTLTAGQSVTVTADSVACNGRLKIGNGKLEDCNGGLVRSVTEATVAVDRPCTVLLDRPPIPSSIPAGIAATADIGADDDVAVADGALARTAEKPVAMPEQVFDVASFLVKQRQAWSECCNHFSKHPISHKLQEHRLPFRATEKHLAASVAAAQRYGVDDYLAALSTWGRFWKSMEEDTVLSIEEITGERKYVQWTLRAFLEKSLDQLVDFVREQRAAAAGGADEEDEGVVDKELVAA